MIDDQGIIELDLENESTFSLQRSGKDIILHCDLFNTDILISNIEQATQQGMVLKVCDTQLPLNQLLTELDSNNNYLELIIGENYLVIDDGGEFFDKEDSYLSDSSYDNLYSITTHNHSDLFYAQ